MVNTKRMRNNITKKQHVYQNEKNSYREKNKNGQ